MKKVEAQSVGDIIRRFMESDGKAENYNRQKVSYLWGQIVGPEINKKTIRRYVDGDILHVYIASAPLKSELAFMVEPLVRKLNEAVGSHVISKIVIH